MNTDIVKELKWRQVGVNKSKCVLCAEEKRIQDADHYCIECKNYYRLPCDGPVGIHKKISLMQGHNILDKSDFKSLRSDGSLPSYPTQRCDQHPLEVITVYCHDHDDVACGLCVAISHRSCEHVIAIADEIDNLYPGRRLTDIKRKLGLMKKTMEDIKLLYKIKLQKQIDVKLNIDKWNCWIGMICVTEDGFVLLPDYDNKRLKRMDLSTEQVKDYIDLQAEPRAVCTVSKNESVVSLVNKSVQFVSLGDKMTVTRTLTMSHACFGLAYNDEKLFIGDNDHIVYIYDMEGREQRRIPTDESGNNIFKRNWQIAVSAATDRVFVADHNGVVVLDGQGNYLSTLSDNNVLDIIGVCTDGKNVLVSGYSSGNIVQFEHSYKILGEVSKVQYPCHLCLDFLSKRMVVSHGLNSNKITVLELE